ncbi:MAG: hypothetical protein VB126_12935, partial [Paludibacter sp.]|nr:hypothetical protein [Paludibacter sp.]
FASLRRTNSKIEASKHTSAPAKTVAKYKYCMLQSSYCILNKEEIIYHKKRTNTLEGHPTPKKI